MYCYNSININQDVFLKYYYRKAIGLNWAKNIPFSIIGKNGQLVGVYYSSSAFDHFHNQVNEMKKEIAQLQKHSNAGDINE